MRNKSILGAMCVLFVTASLAPAAEATLADLLAALKTKQGPVRVAVIDQLGAKGAQAAQAVPALADLLKDKSATVRAHAADALGKIGPAAKSAGPALAALIDDPDKTVRLQALESLLQVHPGPAVGVPVFAKIMEGDDDVLRTRVLNGLTDHGKEAVPFLIELLKNEKTAYWACLVLGQIGADAKDAVPAMAALLADKDLFVRREAIMALAEIGPDAAAAVPQLVKALEHEIDRLPATYALGKIGKATDAAEAVIRKNAESKDVQLANVSVWTLARLHPEDKKLVGEATEKLFTALKSKEPRTRAMAARALAALKPGAEIAMPIMEKAFEGADEEMVHEALNAISGLGPAAVPKLIDALKHEKARPYVVYMLGQIGPEAKDAVAELVKLLDDKNADVRSEVPLALGKIGPAAKAAVPALLKALEAQQETDEHAACGIAHALGKIGPPAADAVPALSKAAAGKHEALAAVGAWALVQIRPKDAKTAAIAVPVLVRALGDRDPLFRHGAAEALGQLGPLGKPAAAALKKALKDEDKGVSDAAAAALKAIGG
jgi:HEAT repeat protein